MTLTMRPKEFLNDHKVRARRIETKKVCVVETGTIGGSMVYCLPMVNVSRTGMLLTIGRYEKVPFQINTLLELNVDPRGQVFDRPIRCIAKVVRLLRDESDRPQYGVHIIQMEHKEQFSWEKTIVRLEAA